MSLTEDLINKYILENKDLIKNYICILSNTTSYTTCSYYITKGKYKNSVCGRKVLSTESPYCKVHSKYIVKSQQVSIENESVGIELTEFIYKEERLLKTKDNVVYGKFDTGYFPIGHYNELDENIEYY